ncbi:hypothetical protein [Bradyrhizobium tropiciagri]|uniref:hypothetical protein n=1 Tax=Bradyrhizobium tropiciagri TaxID=312253 RepID=UPI000A689970|nr:hypothetical protein [Bradyrhizobium tropiciagri]
MTSESQLREKLRKIEAWVPELLVSALQRKQHCSGCGPGSRNLLATIHRSNSNSHFPTSGLGTCFWRFAADMGCGRFVIAGSDATR